MKWPVDEYTYDSPHTKTNMLLQAHFGRFELPIADYYTDTLSVLDQSLRVLQAMVDVSAEAGWLSTTLRVMQLTQMVVQGRWLTDSTLLNLPHITPQTVKVLWQNGIEALPELLAMAPDKLNQIIRSKDIGLSEGATRDLRQILGRLPIIHCRMPNTPLVAGPEQTVTISVNLERKNRDTNMKVLAPKFSKPKNEGWWLAVGRGADDELVALKRVLIRPRGSNPTHLTFMAPSEVGDHTYTVYLMSDCYLGLDQEYDFTVQVVAGAGPSEGGPPVETEAVEDTADSSAPAQDETTASDSAKLDDEMWPSLANKTSKTDWADEPVDH